MNVALQINRSEINDKFGHRLSFHLHVSQSMERLAQTNKPAKKHEHRFGEEQRRFWWNFRAAKKIREPEVIGTGNGRNRKWPEPEMTVTGNYWNRNWSEPELSGTGNKRNRKWSEPEVIGTGSDRNRK